MGCTARWVPFRISIYGISVGGDKILEGTTTNLLLEYLLLKLMKLLQLLDFDLLLPQEARIASVLHGEILLFARRGQGFLDSLGILEGWTIEKVRIRSRLLTVLGEEGRDKVLLAELIRMHGRWVSKREDEQTALVVVVGPQSDRGKSGKKFK